jgi:hypothetical protein
MPENGDEYFVVEYDLPTATRYKFYRQLNRYLENRGMARPSTKSVIITNDADLAYWIYSKAVDVGGKARLYRARLLREWIDDRERPVTRVAANQQSILEVMP